MVRRRTILVAASLAVTGCLSGGGTSGGGSPTRMSTEPSSTRPSTTPPGTAGGDSPHKDDPADGYPPPFESPPTPVDVDPASFETVLQNDVEVPLAPIEVVYNWHRRREARIADARGMAQYERSHILGAVSSPAPRGGDEDPVEGWPKGDRIVCYCGCPHHLSSIRASHLVSNGYEEVYVIDEGFWEWHERDYPMAGTEVGVRPPLRVIRGRTEPRYAGETAWVTHDPTGQQEAAPIDARGRYRLELSFAGVSPESVLRVRTPGYSVQAQLDTLTSTTVTAP